MKQQLLKIASLKVGLITAGALIFVAGTTVAVNHRTVNIKSADSTQASQPTSSNVVDGQTIQSPNNDPVVDSSTATQPSGVSSSSSVMDPTIGTNTPAEADATQSQPHTLISRKIINDQVNQINSDGSIAWQETAQCLSTYSDDSTNTIDMVIGQKTVQFSPQNNGRDCSSLIF